MNPLSPMSAFYTDYQDAIAALKVRLYALKKVAPSEPFLVRYSQLGDQIGKSVSTVSRYILTLEKQGFLKRNHVSKGSANATCITLLENPHD